MNTWQKSVLSGMTGIRRYLYILKTASGGPVTFLVRIFLGRHPVRRVLLAVTVVVAGFLLFSTVTYLSRPLQLASAVSGHMFEDTEDGHPVSNPCDTPVPPGRRAVITRDGTAGPEARRTIAEIPWGADMAAAGGFLLYRWAHPESEFPRDWQDWIDTFYAAGSVMSNHGGTGLNAAETMDPGGDYRPYLRLSRAAVFRLVESGKVTADPERLETEMQDLFAECVE